MGARRIRNIDRRRAVLAVLLREMAPVSLDAIVDELERVERLDLSGGRS